MTRAKPKYGAFLGLAAFALTAFCLIVSILLTALPAQADPDLNAMQSEVDSLRAEIAGINRSAELAIERYNQANVELEGIEQQIRDNQAALEESTVKLAESQQVLEKRINRIYRHGSTDFLEVLFNTTSFNEFISKYDMLERIGDQDKEVVEQVLTYKKQVEQAGVQLEQARNKQHELVATLEAEKAEVEAQLAARQEALAGAEAEVAAALAAEEQARRQEQQQYTAQVVAQLEGAQADPAAPADAAGQAAPPPSTTGGAVSIAMQYVGVPYVWGGASPAGFDCSGLVMFVYAQLGVSLPHSAAGQYYAGTPVSYSQLEPGDLVFFGQPISHVGIYIGGGSMVHAPFEGQVVSIASVGAVGGYSGACRI